jgi:SNF2 family DNA or RNA helicase
VTQAPALFTHQSQAVAELWPTLLRTHGVYVAHAVGTGKSRTSIELVRKLAQEHVGTSQPIRHVLVVTRVSGIGTWRDEIPRWTRAEVPVTFIEKKEQLLALTRGGPQPSGWYLTTYDRLSVWERKKWVHATRALGIDVLVADEAHAAKSPVARRTRTLWSLADLARYRILLSGTPAHSPLDYWAQYRMVDRAHPMWGGRYAEYKKHVAFLGGPHLTWVTGFRKDRVAEVDQVRTRVTHTAGPEVLGQGEPLFTPIRFRLDAEERKHYALMRDEAVLAIGGTDVLAENVLAQTMKLHQIACGWINADTEQGTAPFPIGDSRLDTLVDLLDERSDEKVVVSCRFLHDINRILAHLRQVKRSHVTLTGAQSAAERAQRAREFGASDGPLVAVIQQRAGGEAINGLQEARHLILYSLEPSTIAFQQVIGRLWRQGQRRRVNVVPILAQGTVDEALFVGLRDNLDLVALSQLLRRAILEGGTT